VILYDLLEAAGFRSFAHRLYRVRVDDADRIPANGPCILVANHESLIDPWILGLATPRPIRYMAKAELWRNPLLRPVMNAFGTFPVERGTGDTGALGAAGRLLHEGQILGIFPQGTCLPFRNRPWHRGAARIALTAGATIVPVALVGTERALRPHRIRIGLPRIRVLVGRPLEFARNRPTIAAAKALTQRLEQAVDELRTPFGPPAHAWID
jgi:1-acyl-sn-glycerol-3-phosphate acyltransferase